MNITTKKYTVSVAKVDQAAHNRFMSTEVISIGSALRE